MISLVALLLLGCAPTAPPETEPTTQASPTNPAAPAASVAPADLSDPVAVEARRVALFTQIRAWVKDLEAAGRYDCCAEVSCTHCAILTGGCKCGEGARRGEPVCEECALLWVMGKGAEPGVDPASVRSFLEAGRAGNAPGAPCACEHDKEGASAGRAPSRSSRTP